MVKNKIIAFPLNHKGIETNNVDIYFKILYITSNVSIQRLYVSLKIKVKKLRGQRLN